MSAAELQSCRSFIQCDLKITMSCGGDTIWLGARLTVILFMCDTRKLASNRLDQGSSPSPEKLGPALLQGGPPARPPYVMLLVWCDSHDCFV